MTDTNWLQAARERCAAATEGPWTAAGDSIVAVQGGDPSCRWWVALCGRTSRDEANADFIAHARTDLPLALELLRLAAEALEELEPTCLLRASHGRTWCTWCTAEAARGAKVVHGNDCPYAIPARIRAGDGGGGE